mmetsp:Transcript_14319/g.24366  ORF Transcript_14319/g.24366 Transcript_14319/m.24366 type:complete len:148 (+) Transcript_14319:337-780(+)
MGNLDDAFIEKRRLELEGFLRVLVSTDNKIKNDMMINAFLTFDEDKFTEFKANPTPVLEKMWSMYQSLPNFRSDLKEIKQQGVQKTLKQVFNRVKHEFSGVQEPDILLKDSNNANFEEVQRSLEKSLLILKQAHSEHEKYQRLFIER